VFNLFILDADVNLDWKEFIQKHLRWYLLHSLLLFSADFDVHFDLLDLGFTIEEFKVKKFLDCSHPSVLKLLELLMKYKIICLIE
jgi:hypothetical protein